jgi:hypothetical protein
VCSPVITINAKSWQSLTATCPGASLYDGGPALRGTVTPSGLQRHDKPGLGDVAVAQRPSAQRVQALLGGHESVNAMRAFDGFGVPAMAELSPRGDVSGPYPWRQPV